MKNLTKYVALVAVIMTMSACKLSNIYTDNPTQITDPAQVGFDKLLQAAEINLGSAAEQNGARLSAMWTRQLTGSNRQQAGYQGFNIAGSDMDAEWATWYQGALQPILQLKKGATAVGNRRYAGIAKVIEAYCYGSLADRFGDVPRTQSNDLLQFPQPAFDSQISVYQYVINLLGEAITDLPIASSPSPGADDFFFQGSSSAWIAAANSLRARYALHVARNPAPIFANSAAAYTQAATWAAAGISSAAGNWRMPHGPTYLSNFNTFYSFTTYDRSGDLDAADAYLAFMLDPANIPGRPVPYRGNAKPNETGRANFYYLIGGGYNSGANYEPNILWSVDWGNPPTSDGIFAATASYPIITFEETKLIQAECLIRGGNFAGSLTALNDLRAYYNTGAHLNADYAALNGANPYQAYVSTDFDPAGIENADGISANNALLREILQERYVTLYCQYEALFDAFRTHDTPTNIRVNYPIIGSAAALPVRLIYSQLERNSNPNTPNTTVFTPRMTVNQ